MALSKSLRTDFAHIATLILIEQVTTPSQLAELLDRLSSRAWEESESQIRPSVEWSNKIDLKS